MSNVLVNGVKLYYEIHGAGEPLLLIEGLGYASWSWFRQVEELSYAYRVVTFDNRGVGQSDKPDIPYSIDLMADDVAHLLESLNIERAHILGVSMGGYIAQKLAINYPQMVKSLVLGCTSFGGPQSIPLTEEALQSMLKVEGLNAEEVIRQGFKAAISPKFIKAYPDVVDQLVAWRLDNPTPRYAWDRQFAAARAFNLESQLHKIKVPTLVITGSDDIVVPPQNSSLLAERISGAQLVMIPGGGHLFFIEKAEEFNRKVLEFLETIV